MISSPMGSSYAVPFPVKLAFEGETRVTPPCQSFVSTFRSERVSSGKGFPWWFGVSTLGPAASGKGDPYTSFGRSVVASGSPFSSVTFLLMYFLPLSSPGT